MARKKDLAGLATLAGLAYLASRDKGGSSSTASLGDDQYNPDVKQGPRAASVEPTTDLGEIRDETGALSKLRRNTETGEAYDPTGSGAGKVAPSATPRLRSNATASKPRTAPNPMDAMTGGDYGGPAEKKKLEYQSLQDRVRAYEEERAKSGVGMYGTRKSTPREALPTAEDAAYLKKGGSVKGWGKARGARKAKTY